MLKRNTSICILIIFICALLPFTSFSKVHAYTSNSYLNNLKVGLVSMASTNIKMTLKGEYTLNGQTYASGSVVYLGISGTSITVNGKAVSQINLIPKNQSNLVIITSGIVSNNYMGSFLIKVLSGKILPINILDVENYLKGVVGYEMSDYFPIESLKAQAVAARNYALSRIGYETTKGYDFDDTINYQVYQGYNASFTKVITAVDATKGQVLLYNDKLVETLYSAWNGGVSENSENVWGNTVPYLRSVLDIYENNAWPEGNRVFTNSQIENILKTKGYLTVTDTFIKLDLGSITKFASGRISNINILYKNSLGLGLTKSVVKDSARTFLSLPSSLYIVTYDEIKKIYTFSGKGYGHGLGMSQIGAKNRAAAGQTYDQILKFYYQKTYLQNINVSQAPVNVLNKVYTPILSAITVSGSFYEGKFFTIKASSTDSSPLGINYKFEVYKNITLVGGNNFNASNTFSFTPTAVGEYIIKVYGKDVSSDKAYDTMKQFKVTISSKTLNPPKSPLKFGMKSVDVQALQRSLVNLGYAISDVPGYFGTQTRNQVIAFQANKKLTKDGIAGNATYGALNNALIEKAGVKILTY